MSLRLAAANEMTRVDDRTARRGASLGHEGSRVADRRLHLAASRSFSHDAGRRQGLESWYDGKKLTVAVQQEKVFAQAPMPETIDRTLDALAERYDMALPLADLFYSNPAKALLSDTTTGGYAGTENVGETPCHHLAFRDVGVEWEVWLPVQGRATADAVQDRGQTPHRPAADRSDVQELEPRAADERRHIHAERAGGIRGHRHPAAGRCGQDRGRVDDCPRACCSGEEVEKGRSNEEATGPDADHDLSSRSGRARDVDRNGADVRAGAKQPPRCSGQG